MARWRLTAKHYIHATRNGEPTQWIREETNRDTGRTNRKAYVVPMYLDPEAQSDQNYPGEIIIARPKGAQLRDILVADDFVPTIDMEPLDEEAEVLSAEVRRRGLHPIDSLPAQGVTYAEHLLTRLNEQLEKAARDAPSAPDPAIKKLQEDVARLMDANAKLQAQLVARPKA
jgi:hypothetical protein